eukprot:Lithocolla_globosa_v1_NODE_2401_length_2023_cov_3.586382.p1 type:complete len:215 gc:universal NODE_2401_length_2023_cov_3.586382:1515-871(-)
MSLDRWGSLLRQCSGVDSTVFTVQYTLSLLLFFLKRTQPESELVKRLKYLVGYMGDWRTFFRFYHLVHMLQWHRTVETKKPLSEKLQAIQRLENICNFIYYPLEHAYWLGSHKLISVSQETVNQFSLWSCRAWCGYTLLHFFHLQEEHRLLTKNKDLTLEDREKQQASLKLQTLVNTSFLPLTIQFSLENGFFHELVIIFGGMGAAVGSLVSQY